MPLPLVAMGIGAGLGALNHLFGSHSPQVTTSGVGAEDAAYLRNQRGIAMNMFGQGMNPYDPAFLAAMQGFGGYADAGKMGLAAFTDPAIMAKFMAGDQAALAPIFQRQRDLMDAQSRSRMIANNAFGLKGSNYQPNYSDINNAETMANMQLRSEAANRALQFGQFGQYGLSNMMAGGQYMTERPDIWKQNMMRMIAGAYGGPISTYTSSPNPNDNGSLLGSIAGGAMMGASFGGMGGGGGSSAIIDALHGQGYGNGTYTPWQPPAWNPSLSPNVGPTAGPSGFGQFGQNFRLGN